VLLPLQLLLVFLLQTVVVVLLLSLLEVELASASWRLEPESTR